MTRRKGLTERWMFAMAAFLCSALLVPAATTGVDSGVFGSWVMMDLENAGMHIVSTITIHPDRVEVMSRCSFGDKRVEAKATAPARVTESEIQVTEARNVEKEYSPGFLQCRASITPMTINYYLKDGKLVLTDPGSAQTQELNRAYGK